MLIFIRKAALSKFGDSYGIEIEQDILDKLNINSKLAEFKLEVFNKQIILTPIATLPTTLEEAFEDYDGLSLGDSDRYDWGLSEGREI